MYQIILSDSINNVELNCEEIEMKSIFSVADISDIAVRKDSIKTINLKGTKINNNAFGELFDLGRTTDKSINNKLFFNYNPLRIVESFVFENSLLVYKGSFRINEITVDKNGDTVYSCIITGGFIDFRNVIQDKLLSDLDFSNLKHRITSNNIVNSWATSTERYSDSLSGFTTQPFGYGEAYIYPNIDYGYTFKTGNTTNDISVRNFKPAIYLKTYFDKIFESPFSYEVKGSSDFMNKFKRLIVPDSNESLSETYSGFTITAQKPSPLAFEINRMYGTPFTLSTGVLRISGIEYQLLACNNVSALPANTVTSLITSFNGYSNVLQCNRSFNTNGTFSVFFETIENLRYGIGAIGNIFVKVQLVERNPENNNTANSGWAVVSESSLYVTSSTNLSNQTITGYVGYRDFKKNNQLGIRVVLIGDPSVLYNEINNNSDVYYKVTSTSLTLPNNTLSNLTVEVEEGDTCTPKAPVFIKQVDFVKSFINLFNMYAYPSKEDNKKIIFEKYDDFYALTKPANIINNSLDWTNKIDYTNGIKVKSNLSLPKSYLFTYKADSDIYNDLYRKEYNKVYGQFDFNDALGLVDTKKVELIFSPSVMTNEGGTDRLYTGLYTLNGTDKKVSKSNIRLMYYNGLKPCTPWNLCRENFSAGTYNKVVISGESSYPMASNYYYGTGSTPTNDLHFGRPNKVYFNSSLNHLTATTAYENYYVNNVSELTDINVNYIECSALLNEIDIANLDLRTPIFISTPDGNSSFFKVLNVNYENSDLPSIVNLQRIVVSDLVTISIPTPVEPPYVPPFTGLTNNLIYSEVEGENMGSFIFVNAYSTFPVASYLSVNLELTTQYGIYNKIILIDPSYSVGTTEKINYTSGNPDETWSMCVVTLITPSTDATYNYLK